MNYQKEIEKIIEKEKALAERKQALMSEWVEAEHPLKVGDVAIAADCDYKGKPFVVRDRWVGDQVWSLRRNVGWVETCLIWRASGPLIRKNGLESKKSYAIGQWMQRIDAPDAL